MVRQLLLTTENCWISGFLLFSLVVSKMTGTSRGQPTAQVLSLVLEEHEAPEICVFSLRKMAQVSVQLGLNMQYQIDMPVGQR